MVFSGFPTKSRNKVLVHYVKLQLPEIERLAGHADVLDFGDNIFAPGLRTNVAMIRLPSRSSSVQVLKCLEKGREGRTHRQIWGDELVIRAKRDKSLAIRRAHGKLWQLSTHFKSLGHNDIKIDRKNCLLWINDCEAVKWDLDTDSASWMELDMSEQNLVIDVATANAAMNSARSS